MLGKLIVVAYCILEFLALDQHGFRGLYVPNLDHPGGEGGCQQPWDGCRHREARGRVLGRAESKKLLRAHLPRIVPEQMPGLIARVNIRALDRIPNNILDISSYRSSDLTSITKAL